MTIKNGQRKKFVLLLLFFYSLALSQSALQYEKLLHVDVYSRFHKGVDYPEVWENWKSHSLGDLLLIREFLLLFNLFGQLHCIFLLLFYIIYFKSSCLETGRTRLDKSLLSLVLGIPVRVWTERHVLSYWDLFFLHGAV